MEKQKFISETEVTGSTGADELTAATVAGETTETIEGQRKRKRRRKRTTLELIQTFMLVLRNVNEQPEIAASMAAVGFSAEMVEQGKKLFKQLEEALALHNKERGQMLTASRNHANRWETLCEMIAVDREKAKYVFRQNEEAIHALLLNVPLPKDYLGLHDRIKGFYSRISEDEGMKQGLAQMGLTEEEITGRLSLLSEVNELKGIYMLEKGESQNATEKKNHAYNEADLWMRDFFTLAKIAVRESPQLQEAFGKIIRN